MKPSERIKELGTENIVHNPPYSSSAFNPEKAIRSIIQYLDEQYEQNKSCMHNYEGVMVNDFLVCMKCTKCGHKK